MESRETTLCCSGLLGGFTGITVEVDERHAIYGVKNAHGAYNDVLHRMCDPEDSRNLLLFILTGCLGQA